MEKREPFYTVGGNVSWYSYYETMSHAMQGYPRQTGHSGEFSQNMVSWRREWQTTPVFLLREPHEQYDTAERFQWA